jgi:aspartate ammonia-lyase
MAAIVVHPAMSSSSFRIDKDSLGDVKVPSDAYYGPFTARAMEQYKVTGQKAHINLIKAYAMIKRSAAVANKELKALDAQKADAIVKACDEILGGKLLDQFKVEAINSGAGTAFNMNSNELIANRAVRRHQSQRPRQHVTVKQRHLPHSNARCYFAEHEGNNDVT